MDGTLDRTLASIVDSVKRGSSFSKEASLASSYLQKKSELRKSVENETAKKLLKVATLITNDNDVVTYDDLFEKLSSRSRDIPEFDNPLLKAAADVAMNGVDDKSEKIAQIMEAAVGLQVLSAKLNGVSNYEKTADEIEYSIGYKEGAREAMDELGIEKESARSSSLKAIRAVAGAGPGKLLPGTGRVGGSSSKLTRTSELRPARQEFRKEIRRGATEDAKNWLKGSKTPADRKYWRRQLATERRNTRRFV